MSRIKKQIRRLMNEMDARSARVRPGSVLILVVVLLVLMALLGTAFLITARNDRDAARLYSHNVQIDMLVQGVENMAIAALSDTSYQKSDLQRYDDWYTDLNTSIPGGTPVDHTWLGARYPDTLLNSLGSLSAAPKYPVPKGVVVNGSAGQFVSLVDNNTAAPAPGGNWQSASGFFTNINQPTWSAVSAPLATQCFFEDPRYPTVPVGDTVSPRPAGVRTLVSPTYTTFGGKNYPALMYVSALNNKYETALAASASGNGIADAFLWRLPIGTIDGITYYAAVRIIDNNSQINVNTANSQSYDFNYDGTFNTNPAFLPAIFGSGIGLAELTNTYNASGTNDQTISPELTALNGVRFNVAPPGHPSGIVGSGTTPFDDSGNPRPDFNYITVGDAMGMGLSRRLNNPGRSTASVTFQAFSWGDAAALAYKFDLPNPFASPTATEYCLINSVWNRTGTPGIVSSSVHTNGFQSTPWDPSQWQLWFNQYLEGNASMNRRAYVTPHNPTSNVMPVHVLSTATTGLTSMNFLQYMVPPSPNPSVNYLTGVAPKVSLNTADVALYDRNTLIGSKGPTLWFGFYNAMLDAIPPSATANPALLTTAQGVAQFRSPIRDLNGFQSTYTKSTSYFTGPETVLLRSLLAAVNAKDLRDSGDNVEVANIPTFPASHLGGAGAVNLYAYGTERQVFITEIYVNNEVNAPKTLPAANGQPANANPNFGKTNPKGYVAVEIYNPYDYPVDMSWWTLAVVARTNAGLTASPITNFNGFARTDGQTALLGGHQYMLLQNMPPTGSKIASASPNDAQYLPSNITTNSPQIIYYVPNLHEVLQSPGANNGAAGELVILRQPNAHGSSPNNFDPENLQTPANMPGAMANFAPVDSFDFTGMQPSDGAPGSTLHAWHYVRANPGNNAGTPTTSWKFVYPGRWDPTAYSPYRQEGIQSSTWVAPDPNVDPTPAGQWDPWILTPPTPGINLGLNTGDPVATYANNFPAIQLNNTDMGGPNKLFSNQTPYLYPFGGFARLGDVLQVPFVGAYMIFNGNVLLECNPVTRDVAAADDNDNGVDDSIEQVGRFCPLLAAEQTSSGAENVVPVGGYDAYAWANHILDYFTTNQNPNDDYLPNVDPTVYPYGSWNMGGLVYSNPNGAVGGAGGNIPPLPVGNTVNVGNGPNKGYEDTVGVEGLINVNTANYRVLAAIPWVVPPPNPTPAQIAQTYNQNVVIGKAIVNFRNTYGAFKSLFELNRVPGVQNAPYWSGGSLVVYNPAATTATPAQGNISPLWAQYPTWQSAMPAGAFQSDNVVGDFESRFATIIRVSNLITTRSDTYTVYVLVQGWSGVGTANPSLIVQRRAAFIADRTQLTTSNPSLNITPVQAY
ncbi:MAG TPA: hypothetical protein VFE47_10065 [Tepidisphaeraceae bacterium]|jgi:hypothetical protein|nr:hypothetical protein [Tepidisphaeraceae bacterium]